MGDKPGKFSPQTVPAHRERELVELADRLNEHVRNRSEQVRALASRLSVAEQRERDRMARMLHDELQQMMHSALFQVGIIRKRDKPVPGDLERLESELREAIDLTRDLSIELSPPVLRHEGIAEALKWLGQRMRERHQLEVGIDIQDNLPEVEPGMRLLLFQVIRELLFNVIKHAGTARARVRLHGRDGLLEAEVSDNGAGFDPEAIDDNLQRLSAFGLVTVRERFELFGGKVRIDSAPGEGTSVVLEIPLHIGLSRPDEEPLEEGPGASGNL